MTLGEAIVALAVAGAAGGLIGVEREQAQEGREGAEFGGIRTFPLVALLGALGALLVPVVGWWSIGVPFAALGALLVVSHVRSSQADVGISTEVAALLTFALGATAATPAVLPTDERYLLVLACSATVMALLALKRPLHGFAAKVSRDDIFATTRFVLLAVVVLPLLPNRTYGPLDVLNPFKIGLMIVFVAAISFAGYVATRAVGGRRGLIATGLLGGLVSSTALTLTLSSRVKEDRAIVPLCAVAIVAASTVMFPRMLAIVLVTDAPLAPAVAVPLGVMAVASYIAAWIAYRRVKRAKEAQEVQFRNPFELRKAVAFGLLFAVLLFVAKAAQTYFGATGVYASSVLGALTDVDAVTLSMAELHRGGLAATTAAGGVVTAAVTNTVAKVALAAAIGGRGLGARVAGPMLVAVAIGVAAFALATHIGV